MIRYVASFPGEMSMSDAAYIRLMLREAANAREARDLVIANGGTLVKLDAPRVPSNRIRRAQFAASARP